MACSALLPRTLLYCFNCGKFVGTERITSLICSRKLGGSIRFSIFLGSAPQGHFLRRCWSLAFGAQHAERMEAVRAPRALLPAMLCISVRAKHAMRDLIASHAPLRGGRHTARQNGPNHYPQGIQWDRNPLGTPFSSIFRRATKDGATGGRRNSREVGKNAPPKTKIKRAATSLAARLSSYSTFRTTPKNSGEPSDAVMRYKNGRLRFISTTGASSGSPAPASIPAME